MELITALVQILAGIAIIWIPHFIFKQIAKHKYGDWPKKETL